MRLVSVLIGFALVITGVFLFAWVSTPHEDLPQELRSHIVSESDGYVTEHHPDGISQGRPVYRRHIKFDQDITTHQVDKMINPLQTPKRELMGSLMNCVILTDDGHAGMWCPDLYEWRELSWNQILWARLKHLGRDPFPTEQFP